MAEEGCIVAILVKISINGSVEWLGVPVHFHDTGLAWTDNILVPEAGWGSGVRVGVWSWGIQPGVHFVGFDVLWSGAVPFLAAYLPRSPENARATERRVHDVCLRDNRLERAQNLLHAHKIGGDEQVNRSDDNWDGLVDQ